VKPARLAAALLFAAGALPVSAGETSSFRGITEPLNDATVSATVAGRVARILKKEGEFVRRGEPIVELEKEEQELEVGRRRLVAESKVELESAAHQAQTLEKDYTATKELFQTTQSVSEEELWKRELEFKMATAERDRLATQEAREELEAKIAAAQLKERVISAPFDGVVVKIHVQVGESTSLQEPLVRVADVRQCRFITYVEAASGPAIKAGMKVSLRLEAPQTTVQKTGVVEYASPVVDPSSGLREIKVLFDNAQGDVQPGVAGGMTLASGAAL
jgi:RND family efflux transporter MFP subunit